MKLRILTCLSCILLGAQTYGYTITIKNNAKSRVFYTAHNTNIITGDFTGFINPGQAKNIYTGADCISGVTAEIEFSEKEAGKYDKKQKHYVGFGNHCSDQTLIATESCKKLKDGSVTDCLFELRRK